MEKSEALHAPTDQSYEGFELIHVSGEEWGPEMSCNAEMKTMANQCVSLYYNNLPISLSLN